MDLLWNVCFSGSGLILEEKKLHNLEEKFFNMDSQCSEHVHWERDTEKNLHREREKKKHVPKPCQTKRLE